MACASGRRSDSSSALAAAFSARGGRQSCNLITGDNAGPLCVDGFRRFAPLLGVCQDYASFSGCRFRRSAFDGIVGETDEDNVPIVGLARASDTGPELSAKLRAAGKIKEFEQLMTEGDALLLEEYEKASRIVNGESVRNAIIATCQRVDLWPPKIPPESVEDDDCRYEDVSATLPEIAQRAYNDEVRRAVDSSARGGRLSSLMQRRAFTAAFIVDFGHELGVRLPPMNDTHCMMLQDFLSRVAEWDSSQASSDSVRDAVFGNLMPGPSAEGLHAAATEWWAKNKKQALITAAAVVAVGPIITAGVYIGKWAMKRHSATAALGDEPPSADASASEQTSNGLSAAARAEDECPSTGGVSAEQTLER